MRRVFVPALFSPHPLVLVLDSMKAEEMGSIVDDHQASKSLFVSAGAAKVARAKVARAQIIVPGAREEKGGEEEEVS